MKRVESELVPSPCVRSGAAVYSAKTSEANKKENGAIQRANKIENTKGDETNRNEAKMSLYQANEAK